MTETRQYDTAAFYSSFRNTSICGRGVDGCSAGRTPSALCPFSSYLRLAHFTQIMTILKIEWLYANSFAEFGTASQAPTFLLTNLIVL